MTMVGVKDSTKCITCRERKIKCDKKRPHCGTCRTHSKECKGYEEEPIFINSTLADRGTCSLSRTRSTGSAPTKSTSPAAAAAEGSVSPDISPMNPARSAWDDLLLINWAGRLHYLELYALNVLHVEKRHQRFPEVCWLADALSRVDENFSIKSACLTDVPLPHEGAWANPNQHVVGRCIFLYQTLIPPHYNDEHLQISEVVADTSLVQQRGPEHFRNFPNHHFFVRVYRPHNICDALIAHKPTFLAREEWRTTPWDNFPKSPLDQLLDIAVDLPEFYSRTDEVLKYDLSLDQNCSEAMGLYTECVATKSRLLSWFDGLMGLSPDPGPSSSSFTPLAATASPSTHAPPGGGLDAFTKLYYRAILLTLYPNIQRIDERLPAYTERNNSQAVLREETEAMSMLADSVCLLLNETVHTSPQPDMLLFPFIAAEAFYRQNKPDGLFWCTDFRKCVAMRCAKLVMDFTPLGLAPLPGFL